MSTALRHYDHGGTGALAASTSLSAFSCKDNTDYPVGPAHTHTHKDLGRHISPKHHAMRENPKTLPWYRNALKVCVWAPLLGAQLGLFLWPGVLEAQKICRSWQICRACRSRSVCMAIPAQFRTSCLSFLDATQEPNSGRYELLVLVSSESISHLRAAISYDGPGRLIFFSSLLPFLLLHWSGSKAQGCQE